MDNRQQGGQQEGPKDLKLCRRCEEYYTETGNCDGGCEYWDDYTNS